MFLIVDDNEQNANLIKVIAERIGIDYNYAKDGKTAIEAVKNQTYKAIFMDLEMPDISGVEATIAIKAILPNNSKTEIYAVSAYNPDVFFKNKQEHKKLFKKFITKPFSISEMTRLLENYT